MTNAIIAFVVSFLVASTVLAQDNGATNNDDDIATTEVKEAPLLAVLIVPAVVPLPEPPVDESAALALAQCLVGEVDWGRPTEYAILSHILLYRSRQTGGRMSFEEMTRRYCSVHHVAHPTARQRWVRTLPWGELTSDPGFPETVNWHNYVVPWRHVREFAVNFLRGRIPNPLPAARHWGSEADGDHIRGAVMLPRIVASIEDGQPVQLANVIYSVDPNAIRRVARRRPTGHGVVDARLARGSRHRR
jgi:hypothetical protein